VQRVAGFRNINLEPSRTVREVPLYKYKPRVGHSQISMTMRCVHPTPEQKQEAVKKLEQFNVERVFAIYEKQRQSGSPKRFPQ
jgi:hypothetical protein